MNKKWKFVLTENGWWLRIQDIDQLVAYVNRSNTAGEALDLYLAYALSGKDISEFVAERAKDPLEQTKLMNQIMAIQLHGEDAKVCALEAAKLFQVGIAKTYYDQLTEDGFVNINCVGGCNSCDWDVVAVEYKDKLVFPAYDESDIKIKTYAPIDKREPGYNYHYYAYLGNIQIHDGDKMKWDTEEEAREFVRKYLD